VVAAAALGHVVEQRGHDAGTQGSSRSPPAGCRRGTRARARG
jgi:hypothetical protein